MVQNFNGANFYELIMTNKALAITIKVLYDVKIQIFDEYNLD